MLAVWRLKVGAGAVRTAAPYVFSEYPIRTGSAPVISRLFSSGWEVPMWKVKVLPSVTRSPSSFTTVRAA